MPNVPASGWWVTVTHPDTDRILRADALADPRIEPSINALARIRYPVPRSEQWQDLDTALAEVIPPDMAVYLDGAEQPIDDLVDVTDDRQRQASVLVGRGGIELLDEASVEFDSERRHLAAQQVIDNQTGYASDVDTPSFPVLDDEVMQDVSTEEEFNQRLTIADDIPAIVRSSDVYELTQSGWFHEAEGGTFPNASISASGWSTIIGFNDNVSNDEAITVDANEDDVTLTFTTEHDIPADDIDARFRLRFFDTNQPAFSFTFDGQTMESINRNALTAGESSFDWLRATDVNGVIPDPVPAGSHTFSFSPDEDIGDQDDNLYIDCVGVIDNRWGGSFDETTDADDALDGPQLFPDSVEEETSDATTPFSIFRGGVSLTIDDTSNLQRVQVSNDRGSTWLPADGTEDNTDSLTDIDFSDPSERIRMRIRLAGYEPGTRSKTPKERYDTQTLSAYQILADIRQESLLLDYSETKSVESILNDIVGPSLVWSYRVDDGTKTVTVTQPGQRNAPNDADLIEATVTKDLDTVHEFMVQGSNKTVNNEQFSGSTTFVDLLESDIIPGTEAVRDPNDGTQFDREGDYGMDWSEGKIRITDDGAMSAGTTYEISYNAETTGTHTDPNAPTGSQKRTVEVPGVTSERNAEQIAFVLVEDLKAPRWIIDVTIPPGVTDFDVIEALPLGGLDIPNDAGPFFATERPRRTPRGIEFRLESAFDQERRVQQLRRQVSAVVRRTG